MPTNWPTLLAVHASSVTTRDAMSEVALHVMQRVFGAPIRMVLLARDDAESPEGVHAGMRGIHFQQYVQTWHAHDPVRCAAIACHACVRDVDVTEQVRCSGFRAGFAQRIGAESYLAGPLYGQDGGIAGTVHMARSAAQPPFTSSDARQATAFAAFLSVMLTRMQYSATPSCSLAPRDHQVALLAASGRTNKDIAQRLGLATETVKQTLRRVYRKLRVAGRTQLAAHYARNGVLQATLSLR